MSEAIPWRGQLGKTRLKSDTEVEETALGAEALRWKQLSGVEDQTSQPQHSGVGRRGKVGVAVRSSSCLACFLV